MLQDTSTDNVENNLEKQLENILSKIKGVGEVKVLLTYSETSAIYPIYNESISSSLSTDSGGTTTETKTESKDVFKNSENDAMIQRKTMPKIEGAIVIAKGAETMTVKSNIVAAVEAVTGLLSHKIQVFEMKE